MNKSSLGVVLVLFLYTCSTNKKRDPNVLRVGITSGPERELAETAKKVALEKYKLKIELITFNDYVLPNESLQNEDVDVNAFQHVPYLEEQSKQRGYTLSVVGKTFVYPIVAYSKKIKQVSQLKSGTTIVIPNDPTNGGRALLLLEKNGLLKLKKGVGLLPKVNDIQWYKVKFEILEIEAPQIPSVLDDPNVSLAVINNNFAKKAGLNTKKYGVLFEDKDSPYVNVIVAKSDNKNNPKIKQFVQAYQSDKVEKTAKRIFGTGAIKGW